MAELPIFPIKTDALLADTAHMSAEEFGAYCRLLITMWRQGGSLPMTPLELARIAGVSRQRWVYIKERVMRPMSVTNGVVTQKRLSATWLEVQRLRTKKTSAANKRWKPQGDAGAYADDMQMHMQVQCRCNANQNQIRKTSTFTEAAREEPLVDNTDPQTNPAGSVATALDDGALPRPPGKRKRQPRKQNKKSSLEVSPYLERVVKAKGWA